MFAVCWFKISCKTTECTEFKLSIECYLWGAGARVSQCVRCVYFTVIAYRVCALSTCGSFIVVCFFFQPMKTLPHKHFLHTDQNNCPVCPKLRMFFFLHSFIRFRSFIWCVECNNAQRLLIALLIILITHSEEFLISRLEFHNTKIH